MPQYSLWGWACRDRQWRSQSTDTGHPGRTDAPGLQPAFCGNTR